MRILRKIVLQFCFLGCLVSSLGRIHADIVTNTFTGVITLVNSGGQGGTSIGSADGISVGTPFTATFSYQTNSSSADFDITTSQGLFFISPTVETFLTMSVGGKVFEKSATGNLTVQTFNNIASALSPNTDLLSLAAIGPTLPTGWSVANPTTAISRLTFFDALGLAMASDALPNTFSPNWSLGVFSQQFNDSVTTPSGTISQLYFEGSLNLVAVPEPASWACIAMAIGCIAIARRFLNFWSGRLPASAAS
ncbi:MAG: hypothetical protein ABL921_15970 [Pirellula sp.]